MCVLLFLVVRVARVCFISCMLLMAFVVCVCVVVVFCVLLFVCLGVCLLPLCLSAAFNMLLCFVVCRLLLV